MDPLDANHWQRRWKEGSTGWRVREREQLPFEKNAFGILSLLPKEGVESNDLSAFRGARVFVPLCGDTLAVGFWHALGCDVVGIDVAAQSIESAMKEQFSTIEFTSQVITVGDAGVADNTFKVFDAVLDASAPRLQYWVGDYFTFVEEVVGNPQVEPSLVTSFDVVYDRASMVAMSPSQLDRYVAGIQKVLRTVTQEPKCPLFVGARTKALLLSVIERPEHQRDNGPPFHVSEQEVSRCYAHIAKALVPLWDERSLASSADPPPFVDAVYGIVI